MAESPKRSTRGGLVLAFFVFLAFPISPFFVGMPILDPLLFGRLLLGMLFAFLICCIAVNTQDYSSYLKGAGQLIWGEKHELEHINWQMVLQLVVAIVTVALSFWRSKEPGTMALFLIVFFPTLAGATFALVVSVMAFGDLVDWLINQIRK